MFVKILFKTAAAGLAGTIIFALALALLSSFTSSVKAEILSVALAGGLGYFAGAFIMTSLTRARSVLIGSLFSVLLAACSTTYIFAGDPRQIPWAVGFAAAGWAGAWAADRLRTSFGDGS
jgi:hypothetical protein